MQVGFVFLLGTVLGSFLNVCVYRLPRHESLVWPRSYCGHCKSTIPMWWNVPLLSFLLLRGRCRYCRMPISFVYPLVEFLTGFLLLLLWLDYGPGAPFLHYATLVLFLLPISFIDLNHRLILNVLTFPGMLLGLFLGSVTRQMPLAQSALGLFLGAGFLWLIGVGGRWLFKQESMGGGDIKLGAMIGTFLGAKVVLALFLAFVLAAPVVAIGLALGRLKPGSTIPFGPFISLGAVVLVCFGNELYRLYLTVFGLTAV